MRIGDRLIQHQLPPYIIAEIGVNHDGSVSTAKRLVDDAAHAGADAIKLQYFDPSLLLGDNAMLASYQQGAGETSARDMLDRLQFTPDQMAVVFDHARQAGLHAIITVFSQPLVDHAEQLCVDAYKTASPDLIHRPLLESLMHTGRPLIVSTGASSEPEIRRALNWLESATDRLALLQCVSAYPTKPNHASLAGISALKRLGANIVGYSDHTMLVETAGLAVCCGARILEKHLTHDRTARGPDHAASLEVAQFTQYVASAHAAWRMLGEPIKQVHEIEVQVRIAARQSIVARHRIDAGKQIGPDDLAICRPSGGMEPWRLNEIIGAEARRTIQAGQQLSEADLARVLA